jgi:hypothetical protein
MLFRLFGKNYDSSNITVMVDDAYHFALFGKSERDFGKISLKFIGNEKGRSSFGEIAQLAHHFPVLKKESLKKKGDIKAGSVLDEFNAGRFSSVHHTVNSFYLCDIPFDSDDKNANPFSPLNKKSHFVPERVGRTDCLCLVRLNAARCF